ncbi:MAG: hypothetical protein MJH10_11075 [Epibacterium sp.]|nr:hypothetical protein [Epibacterium sp.]NQX74087.1 hypothetical protein [Epibacterium sp.]
MIERDATHPEVIREWTGTAPKPRQPLAHLPTMRTPSLWHRVWSWLNTPMF